MKGLLRRFLLLSLLSSSPLFAGEAERYALVIGNAAYEGEARLAHPTTDASDVADSLKSIGWKVTLVLDGDRKALNRAISSFRDLLAEVESPTALLYYAGHGIQINGQNYLIPVGESFQSADDVVHDAVGLPTVQEAFDEGHAVLQIFILDACRDNPFAKKSSRSLGASRGLSVVSKSSLVEGSAVMFATAPGETAADGAGRNGLFTQALLKYLDTDLKLQDLATKVTGEVKKLSGGAQVPYNSLSLSDDFYMVSASLRAARAPTPTLVAKVGGQGKPFVLTVNGPVKGMKVMIDGVEVGTTPYQAQYEESRPMTLQLIHPDYITYRMTVDPQGLDRVTVSPEPEHTTGFQLASLAKQRAELENTKKRAQENAGWLTWAQWGGWAGAALGLGLAGFEYWEGGQSLAAYQSAANPANPDQAGMDAARAQGGTANLLFKVGLGTGLVSAALVGSTYFLGPDTASIDAQIQAVGTKIQLFSGQ